MAIHRPYCKCGKLMVASASGWACPDIQCDSRVIPYGGPAPELECGTGRTVAAEFAEDEECEHCDGEGYVRCGHCDGDGKETCFHCGYDHDCEECDGDGDVECDECGGTGIVRSKTT